MISESLAFLIAPNGVVDIAVPIRSKPASIIWVDIDSSKVERVREWWEFHKLEDEARLRREAERRRKDDLKKSAMDKLSPEEKAALNIKT